VKSEQLIFRICSVMRAVEQTAGLSELDPASRLILTFIGAAEAEQKVLKVSDVVRGGGFGTPPTVYSRLNELEKGGWIEYAPDPRDGRARQVFLSRLARRAYAKMSHQAQMLLETS
jgi:hypothetical protein